MRPWSYLSEKRCARAATYSHQPAGEPTHPAVVETLEGRCLLSAAADTPLAVTYAGTLRARHDHGKAAGELMTLRVAGQSADGRVFGTLSSASVGDAAFTGTVDGRRIRLSFAGGDGGAAGVLTAKAGRHGLVVSGKLTDPADGVRGSSSSRARPPPA